jgi:hypothetical protein
MDTLTAHTNRSSETKAASSVSACGQPFPAKVSCAPGGGKAEILAARKRQKWSQRAVSPLPHTLLARAAPSSVTMDASSPELSENASIASVESEEESLTPTAAAHMCTSKQPRRDRPSESRHPLGTSSALSPDCCCAESWRKSCSSARTP